MAEQILFGRSIYSIDAVQAAVEAYGHLATFAVETEGAGDDIVVSVSNIDERVADRLVDALCNHALYETVSRSRLVS